MEKSIGEENNSVNTIEKISYPFGNKARILYFV